MADQGSESSHIEYPLDTDPQAKALEQVFRYAFFDDEGKPFLVDTHGDPIHDPTVASIGPGAFAAHEHAALQNIFGSNTQYDAAEPDLAGASLSQMVEDDGGTGQFDLQRITAAQLLDKLGHDRTYDEFLKVPEALQGKTYDLLLSRNPYGSEGMLVSDQGRREMAQLAEHVNPGGLVAMTFTHYEGSVVDAEHGGSEGEYSEKFRAMMAQQGFDVLRFGKRPGVTDKSTLASKLVYDDSGVLVMRRRIPQAPLSGGPASPAPAPAGRPA